MIAIRKFTALALPMVAAVTLIAGTANAAARDELNRFTGGLKTASAAFSQQVFTQSGKLKESTSGGLAMQQPRLFRWVYTKPYPQTVVADGSKIWIYEPDLKQVTVRSQGAEEANSPLAILVNPGLLDKQFVVTENGSAGGLQWLSLAPRTGTEAPFTTAKLGFKDGLLRQMEFNDNLGQKTSITFSNWKRNLSIAPSNFKFTPPKGVDVIGG